MSSKKRYLGRKTRLYIGDKWETTVWSHIETRDTLAVPLSKNLEDVTAEDSDGEEWQQTVSKKRGVNFTMFYGEDAMKDAIYAKVEAAWESDEVLPFAIADAAITTPGIKYRKLDLFVSEFNDQRDSKGVGKVTVTLTPGPTVNKPITVTVAGGT